MKKIKKIISLVLGMIMMLSMMALPVFAEAVETTTAAPENDDLASYLITGGVVLLLLVGFYVFLILKTKKK